MKIGQLAKRSGVRIDTLRYYERIGLLDEPARTPSGYRQHTAEVVARPHFIQRARGLGSSLAALEANANSSEATEGGAS